MRTTTLVAAVLLAGCGPRAELVDAVTESNRVTAEAYRDFAASIESGKKPSDASVKAFADDIRSRRIIALRPVEEYMDAAEAMGTAEYAKRLRSVAEAYETDQGESALFTVGILVCMAAVSLWVQRKKHAAGYADGFAAGKAQPNE